VNIPDFLYSVVLKPKPLRFITNACLRAILPEQVVRRNATIVLNRRDPVISGALVFDVYERGETTFFLDVCRPGSVFLDIGANSGYYTALFLARTGADSRVVAMEPDPECFELLQRTVRANGGRNTTCLQLAASETAGSTYLYRNPDNRGDNRLYWHDRAASRCRVDTVSVDSVLSELHIPEVNLIKMDVQGFEPVVLRGMERTLARGSRMILMSEFWPWGIERTGEDPVRMLVSLEGLGFRLFHLTRSGRLAPVEDFRRFALAFPGRHYASIVALKGVDLGC
jgi:FkbM family methyltransferase